jgi:hypothetical protein
MAHNSVRSSHAERTQRLLRLCGKPGQQRSQADIWAIRDGLHEACTFFRLWPPCLQQLMCRIVRAQCWVRHEVLAAPGSTPQELVFILDGQVCGVFGACCGAAAAASYA